MLRASSPALAGECLCLLLGVLNVMQNRAPLEFRQILMIPVELQQGVGAPLELQQGTWVPFELQQETQISS